MDILEIYSALDALGIFLGIVFIFLLGFLLFGVIVYIFTGIAYYKAAEVESIPNNWLAWIPVGNSYIMLRLAEKNMNFLFVFIASMAERRREEGGGEAVKVPPSGGPGWMMSRYD